MKKPRLPKINSIHYGGPWIALSFAVGLLIPWIVWLITGVWPFWLTRIGGTTLVGFIILFTLEMNQDFGKTPYCEKTLKDRFPYDPEKQEAVMRCSVYTGEKIAGFKNKADGHFTEVMMIRSPEEEQRFKDTYGINKLKKEY